MRTDTLSCKIDFLLLICLITNQKLVFSPKFLCTVDPKGVSNAIELLFYRFESNHLQNFFWISKILCQNFLWWFWSFGYFVAEQPSEAHSAVCGYNSELIELNPTLIRNYKSTHKINFIPLKMLFKKFNINAILLLLLLLLLFILTGT